MEDGRGSGDTSSELVVKKNRSSSGCLIVRKKGGAGDGVGPSRVRNKGFESKEKKKKKKRHRVELGESGSSDELPMPPRPRLGPDTIRVCNGLSGFDKGSDGRRKIKSREEGVRRDEIGLVSREEFSERKRNRLDVFEFDEYDGIDVEMVRRKKMDDGGEGRKFYGSVMVGRSDSGREYETGSSRRDGIERRKSSSFERSGGLSRGDGTQHHISMLRDKQDSSEPIRVQGKNGVLKVMVNKKRKASSDGSVNMYNRLEAAVVRKGPRIEDAVRTNVLMRSPPYSEPKIVEKVNSFSRTMKSPLSLPKSSLAKHSKISKQDLEYKSVPVKLGKVEVRNLLKKPMLRKNSKVLDEDSEDSDASLKLGQKSLEAHNTVKGTGKGVEKSPSNESLPMKVKEGKVKRGTGTEKQKLREKIRQMLLDAGWTIDYRPRRNRDYLDAVYINPSGTAYWSIIKAYDALLKQLNEDEEDAKSGDDDSPFTPLPNELLSQLTRKTKKKIEKEMKKKKRDNSDSQNVRATPARKSLSSRHDEESMDSGSHEEKLSSFIKLGSKAVKNRTNGTASASVNSKDQNSTRDSFEKPSSGSNSHQGRKSRKLGRCMLLIRNSTEGQDSETDGFIPYTGKRTLLSWLIDCGTVQLSQKVLYMNRRRTKVMLEGWVTREGVHCGCCSKILTVSKFEIHAGSKLRQPYQNICLESGVSLLECQVDAWNQQESSEQIGFNTVDTDGDDPNDDTCGLCGDGGDLICCDGCPSTFHQSCLDIEMLPPGDWHCPNCTCKFCGVASEKLVTGDDSTISPILTCSLCAKRYHKTCILEKDDTSVDADNSISCFCGRKCRELSEQLQRYLGVKHELEAGFSWSLIHRTDADLESALVGLPQRVECNSKLAVALSVMDECFLPIVDRRSGINLIHNVLYNCGSNFNRLNYGGFYAAILERGDEIISAASIRFHGTRLAEMPFIGTRHIYRRQGMCRRLFSAIESALSSFKIEKLIIPAISELMHTWTEVFGFATLDKSLKQELKSMNMLVFPGVDMLQKQLFELEKNEGNKSISTAEMHCSQPIESEVAIEPVDCSAEDDHHENSNAELATAYSDSKHLGIPANGTSLMSSSLDASHDKKCAESLKETENTDPESDDKLNEYAVGNRNCMSNARQDIKELDDETRSHSLVLGNDHSQVQPNATLDDLGSPCPDVHLDDALVMNGSLDVSHEHENGMLLEGNMLADSEPGGLLLPSNSSHKDSIMADMVGVKPELVSPANDLCQYSNDHACEMDCKLDMASISVDETKYHDQSAPCVPEDGFNGVISEGKGDSGSISVPEAKHCDQSIPCLPENIVNDDASKGKRDSGSV